MKPLRFVLSTVAPALLAGTLAACSTWPGHEGQKATPKQRSGVSQSPSGPMRGPGSSSGSTGGSGSTGSGSEQMASGMTGDQAAMCELNRRIASARSPAERQAMMDLYLPGMTAEMREQHLKMMGERCQ
jgi:hypothetical protein